MIEFISSDNNHICVCSYNTTSKHIKQKLTRSRKGMNKFSIIGKISIPFLSAINRTGITSKTEGLNNTPKYLDLVNICRTMCLTSA